MIAYIIRKAQNVISSRTLPPSTHISLPNRNFYQILSVAAQQDKTAETRQAPPFSGKNKNIGQCSRYVTGQSQQREILKVIHKLYLLKPHNRNTGR